MKSFILLVIILFFCSIAMAASVTFEWDPNAPEEHVMGYKLHLGTSSRSYSRVIDAGNVTRFTVQDLSDGNYFAAATAYDAAGNTSDYSNEVQFVIDTVAPSGVKNFRFISVGRD